MPSLFLDFSTQPYSIGDTILALAGAMADSDGADFDVVVSADPGVPHADQNMRERHSRPWESLGALLPLFELAPVRSLAVSAKSDGRRGEYLTYLACQKIAAHHKRHGRPPRLRFDAAAADPEGAITVNLRRSTTHHGHRNYDPAVWAEALDRAHELHGAHFLVVCEAHEIDPRLRGRGYVRFAKDHGTTMLQDLALIHRSRAHIGSTSGPQAVAMLGTAPYFFVGADMKAHLPRYGGALVEDSAGDMGFSWASPRQRFSPQRETVPLLVDAIGRLLS